MAKDIEAIEDFQMKAVQVMLTWLPEIKKFLGYMWEGIQELVALVRWAVEQWFPKTSQEWLSESRKNWEKFQKETDPKKAAEHASAAQKSALGAAGTAASTTSGGGVMSWYDRKTSPRSQWSETDAEKSARVAAEQEARAAGYTKSIMDRYSRKGVSITPEIREKAIKAGKDWALSYERRGGDAEIGAMLDKETTLPSEREAVERRVERANKKAVPSGMGTEGGVALQRAGKSLPEGGILIRSEGVFKLLDANGNIVDTISAGGKVVNR
jgi:hypothetical protein